MNAPSFLETHISQIPAVQLLQQMGFAYLSPEDVAVERRGKLGPVLLENVLAAQLCRINRVRAKGRELPFTEDAITQAVEKLRSIPYDGLCRTAEQINDLLTLRMSLDQTVDGESKGRSLRFIDVDLPRNNAFHVSAELKVARPASHETRRPDVAGFVNGIPCVVIECQRRDDQDAIAVAIWQNLRSSVSASPQASLGALDPVRISLRPGIKPELRIPVPRIEILRRATPEEEVGAAPKIPRQRPDCAQPEIGDRAGEENCEANDHGGLRGKSTPSKGRSGLTMGPYFSSLFPSSPNVCRTSLPRHVGPPPVTTGGFFLPGLFGA